MIPVSELVSKPIPVGCFGQKVRGRAVVTPRSDTALLVEVLSGAASVMKGLRTMRNDFLCNIPVGPRRLQVTPPAVRV